MPWPVSPEAHPFARGKSPVTHRALPNLPSETPPPRSSASSPAHRVVPLTMADCAPCWHTELPGLPMCTGRRLSSPTWHLGPSPATDCAGSVGSKFQTEEALALVVLVPSLQQDLLSPCPHPTLPTFPHLHPGPRAGAATAHSSCLSVWLNLVQVWHDLANSEPACLGEGRPELVWCSADLPLDQRRFARQRSLESMYMWH